MVAKRSVKSSRHPLRVAPTRETRGAIGAGEHVERRQLSAAVRHDTHVAREHLRQRMEIARAVVATSPNEKSNTYNLNESKASAVAILPSTTAPGSPAPLRCVS
jgi:hypothetical protein